MAAVVFGEVGNPATPFQKNLLDVINHTNEEEPLPTQEALESLLGYLCNQEDKIRAIEYDTIQALFVHYEAALITKDEDVDVYGPQRVVIVQLLHRLTSVQLGQYKLASEGLHKVLYLLRDTHEPVRVEVCKLIGQLASLPDLKDELLDEANNVMDTLYNVFLTDLGQDVRAEALNPLSILSEYDPQMSKDSMAGLVELLRASYDVKVEGQPDGDEQSTVENIALTTTMLQTLANVCCAANMKKLAVQLEVIEAVAPLISSHELEIAVLASSVILGVTVAQSGKTAAIKCEGLLAEVCLLAAARDPVTPVELRANAIGVIRNLAYDTVGLPLVAELLLKSATAEVILEILPLIKAGEVIDLNLEGKLMSKCLDLLTGMSETEEGVNACFGICEIVPRLDAATKVDATVLDQVSQLLQAICTTEEAQHELSLVRSA